MWILFTVESTRRFVHVKEWIALTWLWQAQLCNVRHQDVSQRLHFIGAQTSVCMRVCVGVCVCASGSMRVYVYVCVHACAKRVRSVFKYLRSLVFLLNCVCLKLRVSIIVIKWSKCFIINLRNIRTMRAPSLIEKRT